MNRSEELAAIADWIQKNGIRRITYKEAAAAAEAKEQLRRQRQQAQRALFGEVR